MIVPLIKYAMTAEVSRQQLIFQRLNKPCLETECTNLIKRIAESTEVDELEQCRQEIEKLTGNIYVLLADVLNAEFVKALKH